MTEPTYEELKAQLAALQEKNKGRGPRAIDFKVSEKGGVSVYGLGRFPVTLYYEQWIRLLDQASELRAFLEAEQAQPEAEKRRGLTTPHCLHTAWIVLRAEATRTHLASGLAAPTRLGSCQLEHTPRFDFRSLTAGCSWRLLPGWRSIRWPTQSLAPSPFA